MTDPETIRVYDTRAAEYAARFQGAPDPAQDAFASALPARARVLDLGCGPGHMAARLADAGHEVLATDASAEMVRLAGRHPGVTAQQATFDDLGALPSASLDGVWANFSLLHAPRDRFDAHLADIATALRPGGLFHIGMKTGKDSARDALGRSYTYYSAVDLTARLDAQGFEILEQSQGAEAGLAGAVEPWITLLTRKTDG